MTNFIDLKKAVLHLINKTRGILWLSASQNQAGCSVNIEQNKTIFKKRYRVRIRRRRWWKIW